MYVCMRSAVILSGNVLYRSRAKSVIDIESQLNLNTTPIKLTSRKKAQIYV